MTEKEFNYISNLTSRLRSKFYENNKSIKQRSENISDFCLNNIFLNSNLRNLTNEMQRNLRGFACELYLDIKLEEYELAVRKKFGIEIAHLSNLLLPTIDKNDNLTTTQLDTLVITPDRLISIEAKSMFGIVEIDEDILRATSNNHTIQIEPWRQNTAHILALQPILHGFEGSPYKDSNIKVPPILNAVFLYSIGELKSYKPKNLTPIRSNYLIVPKAFSKSLSTIVFRNLNPYGTYDINNARHKNKLTKETKEFFKKYIPDNKEMYTHIKKLERKNK